MTTPADKVVAALKVAKGPGDVFKALAQDPALLVGLVVILGLILLFLRIYLWPQVNPFDFKWLTDGWNSFWNWLTWPFRGRQQQPPQEYPFAKVLYPNREMS